jgi:hypothetical protein
MAVDHPTVIKEILGQFKSIDPQLYEKLLRNMDGYTFNILAAVTEADNSQVLQAQGRAQQARVFMRMLDEAKEPNRTTP